MKFSSKQKLTLWAFLVLACAVLLRLALRSGPETEPAEVPARPAGLISTPSQPGTSFQAKPGTDEGRSSIDGLPPKPSVLPSEAKEIESVLADTSLDNATVLKRMTDIARRTSASAAVRTAAMTHAFNIAPDEQYLQLLIGMLEVEMTAEVFEPAWANLFERPTPQQLEAAWLIAKKQGHTHQEPAVEFLEQYIGRQSNRDPGTWKAAVDAYLKANPTP